jgi:hypothetical protein
LQVQSAIVEEPGRLEENGRQRDATSPPVQNVFAWQRLQATPSSPRKRGSQVQASGLALPTAPRVELLL